MFRKRNEYQKKERKRSIEINNERKNELRMITWWMYFMKIIQSYWDKIFHQNELSSSNLYSFKKYDFIIWNIFD